MKQMKINVFEQIDKKIANNITTNYNDVEYFNIQSEENQYHYGILTLWDIRNKKMKQTSKLTISDKLDFIITEINNIKEDIVEMKQDIIVIKQDIVDIKYRLTRLESFHTKDIENYLQQHPKN